MVERNDNTEQILKRAGEQEPEIGAGSELLSFTALHWSEGLMESVLQLGVSGEFAHVRVHKTDRPVSMAQCREDLNVLEVIDHNGKVRWLLVYDSDEFWQDAEVLVII